MYLGIEITRQSFDLRTISSRARPQPRQCARSLMRELRRQRYGSATGGRDGDWDDLNNYVVNAAKFAVTSDEQKLAVLEFLARRNVQFVETNGILKVCNPDQYDPGPQYRDYAPLVTGMYEVGIVDAELDLVMGQIPTQVMYIMQPGMPTFRLVQISAITTNLANFTPIDTGNAIARAYEGRT